MEVQTAKKKSKPTTTPTRRSHGQLHEGQHANVQSILHNSRTQAKLKVGQSDDKYEQEADRVAEQVVSGKTAELSSDANVAGDGNSQQSSNVRSLTVNSHTAPKAANNPDVNSMSKRNSSTVSSVSSLDVQRACTQCDEELQREPDEEAVGNKIFSSDAQLVNSQLISQIALIRGRGQTLSNRDYFESRMGHDFSQTRVHTDSNAENLAARLGARAFTYHNNIVFANGEYSPESHGGRRLIAHELAHVVQQGAAEQIQSDVVLKSQSQVPYIQAEVSDGNTGTGATGDTGAPVEIPNVAGDKNTGLVNRQAETITWSRITIPSFKNRRHRRVRYQAMSPLERGKGRRVDRTGENDPAQRQKWLSEVDKTKIREDLQEKVKVANAGEMPEHNEHVFEVRAADRKNRYYNGTLDNITTEFLTPTWGGTGRRGTAQFFHVDHIVELQLANWPHSTRGNDLENMELLEGQRNMTSGQNIRNEILNKINGFIRATNSVYGATPQEIKERYTLVFETAVGSDGPSVRRENYWQREEIENAVHLKAVTAADPTKIGGPGLVRVFSRPNGGVSRAFSWSGNTTEEQAVPSSGATRGEREWLNPFKITHKFFRTDPESETENPDFGYLRVHVSQQHPVFKTTEPFDLQLSRFAGARYGGALPDSTRTTIGSLKADFLSPISFDEVDIFGDRGVVATGNINVTLPFFNDGTDIGIRLENGNLEIFKEFSVDDIAVPAPFNINECNLQLSYGLANGWASSGQVGFQIDGVGDGSVSVGLAGDEGFSADGEFNFESELFNPATLQVGYRNNNWNISGDVGFESGLISGIESGLLHVGWDNSVLSGNGDVAFSYPWLSNGSLEFFHSQTAGFSLGAMVELTNAVPGLRSGTVNARVSKNSEGIWSLGGLIRGDLNTDRIPGFTAVVLQGEIQDGIFDASVQANFQRDIATGLVLVGVTNQALDANGQPIEGEATDVLVFYGSGNIELQLTPWLAADAGVIFDRDGGVSLGGGIEVTEDIEILSDEQTPDFELPRARQPSFDVNIPLVSIAVADIALDLGGRLNAYLRTSPLILTDVRLNVFYDFDDPQATRVDGNARLHMDAQAGLAGALELGLSARVLVLRGGGRIALTIGAELDGNMDLTTQPSWNVQQGFAIDAGLDVVVQPVIFVSLDGYLYAEIDVLLGSVDVWESDRLNLADERLPLDIRLGATADAHYREKPNNSLTYSGIQWIVPTAEEMSDALIDLVKDKV